MEIIFSKVKFSNLKLSLKKKSCYNVFYAFQTAFQNANIKWKSFFYCRYSILLEKILALMWNLHCINGYLLYNMGVSFLLKVCLKKDLKGHGAINNLIYYSLTAFIPWVKLKKILNKERSVIYILTTTFGIFDGHSALKKGLGGCFLYKIFL